jgi:hypothetical protein
MTEEWIPDLNSVDGLRDELHCGTLTLKDFWTNHPKVEDTPENREILKKIIKLVDEACNLLPVKENQYSD